MPQKEEGEMHSGDAVEGKICFAETSAASFITGTEELSHPLAVQSPLRELATECQLCRALLREREQRLKSLSSQRAF